MNNQIKSLFLKEDTEEEKEDEYLYLRKKNKQKFQKFQKFKPKVFPKVKNKPFLKGAENKVKSILSNILFTIESEDSQNNKKIQLLKEQLSTKRVTFGYERDKKVKII